METIGEKLRRLRNYEDLTLEDVSIQIGVKLATLSAYENGYRTPGLKTLMKLSDFYDVTIDYLLGRGKTNNKGEIIKEIENIEIQISKLKERIKRS